MRRLQARMRALVLAPVVMLVLACATTSPAWAVKPDEMLADPSQESRARALSGELRCLVCQNESIDDSNAPLARDLRLLVRERITAGDSDRQVIDFLVARYGEFVLLRPVFSLGNAILWLGPFAILAIGGFVILRKARTRPAPAVTGANALSEDEQKALDVLLAKKD